MPHDIIFSNKTHGKEKEAEISELWHLSIQAPVMQAEALFTRRQLDICPATGNSELIHSFALLAHTAFVVLIILVFLFNYYYLDSQVLLPSLNFLQFPYLPRGEWGKVRVSIWMLSGVNPLQMVLENRKVIPAMRQNTLGKSRGPCTFSFT